MSAPGGVRRAPATRDDWETPPEFFATVDKEFRFTLDGAAGEDNRKCERWLSGPCSNSDDCGCGLCADWLDNVVWLNPPYGTGLQTWVEKCRKAAVRGATVVALLPNATDARWFRYVYQTAAEVRLLVGRLQFVGTTSSNPSGSVLAIWRPCIDRGWQKRPALVWVWDWKLEGVG